jgi:radical SAM superfamily enzyme
VVKGTELEALFLKGGYQPMELEEYVDLATEFLEYLSANTVIQRISADCPKEWLVAPLWISDKHRVLRRIEERMTQKRSSGTASAFPEALLPNSQAPL